MLQRLVRDMTVYDYSDPDPCLPTLVALIEFGLSGLTWSPADHCQMGGEKETYLGLYGTIWHNTHLIHTVWEKDKIDDGWVIPNHWTKCLLNSRLEACKYFKYFPVLTIWWVLPTNIRHCGLLNWLAQRTILDLCLMYEYSPFNLVNTKHIKPAISIFTKISMIIVSWVLIKCICC